MRKKSEILIRAVSLILTLLLITGTLCCGVFTAGAAQTTKAEKTYDIAVVFDNSGSMYKNEAWSRAKYAMEIFASMLDFSKDKLSVFPMWEVTTDGKTTTGGSYDRIEITSKEAIDKIKNMYTPNPWETPFAPVKEAERYLKASAADEKWLIVLTDGGFTQYERNKDEYETIADENPTFNLRDELISITSSGIKVQYLGFGAAGKLDPDESSNLYSNKGSRGNVQEDLISICNTIFQRSVLDDDCYDEEDGELELEMSMQKIIVFAQGSDAEIKGLSSEKGDKVEMLFNSDQRKWNDISAGASFAGAEPDKSLAGQVVTFGECSKGEYILDCTGADRVQIFYEPYLDIKVELINSDGNPVDYTKKELLEGEYTIRTTIIDGVTGEDVTDSDLLEIESLVTKYKTSDDEDYKVYSEYGKKDGGTINFEAGKTVDILIEGRYLDVFTITSEGNPDFKGLNFIVENIPFKATAEVLQKKSSFAHWPDNEWKKIKVSFTLEGQPLTKEQLDRVQFSFKFEEDLEYTYDTVLEESAIYIDISGNKSMGEDVLNENGKKEKKIFEPTGDYKFTVQASYTTEKGKTVTGGDTAEFEIIPIEKKYIDLLWLLIILLILTLITLWLLHPVLPKRVIISEGHFTKNATIKGSFKMPSRYDIRAVPVSGKAKVVPKMRNAWIMSKLKPRRMNFRVVDVNCSGIGELTVDGVTYTCENGKLYDVAGQEVKTMIISNSAVSWDENKGGLFEGTLNINRR